MIIEYLERTYDYSKLQILNGKHYYHKNEIIIGSFNWTQLISKCGMMTFSPFALLLLSKCKMSSIYKRFFLI